LPDLSAKEPDGLAGLTAGQDSHLTPKINWVKYSTKSYLVNSLKGNYNILVMERIVNQIHKLLIKNNENISVAESCTGGLFSKLLTDISGSSQYFILGIVAYSNTAKNNILKIPGLLIIRKGAVSKEVAETMDESIRKIAKTDFGVGITGIAGPTGGSSRKPVGTVFIAIASKNKKICKRLLFRGGRNTIRKNAALKTLILLKKFIQP